MDAESATGTWLVTLPLATDHATAEHMAQALDEVTDAQSAHEIDEDIWSVRGYSADKPDMSELNSRVALAAAAIGIPAPDIVLERLAGVDWVARVYEGFQPLRLGRFYIHGSHIADPVPAGSWPLCIDAATAFGTGEHGSTSGCLLALTALRRHHRPRRVLDVGTGTGVLAMAAVRAGARRAVAVDIDPRAVAVAARNVRVNGLQRWIRTGMADGTASRLVPPGRPYDLVFANILAGPLVRLSRDLCREVAPGGYIVLAGLLQTQAVKVANAYRRQGLHLHGRIQRGIWTTLVLRRKP